MFLRKSWSEMFFIIYDCLHEGWQDLQNHDTKPWRQVATLTSLVWSFHHSIVIWSSWSSLHQFHPEKLGAAELSTENRMQLYPESVPVLLLRFLQCMAMMALWHHHYPLNSAVLTWILVRLPSEYIHFPPWGTVSGPRPYFQGLFLNHSPGRATPSLGRLIPTLIPRWVTLNNAQRWVGYSVTTYRAWCCWYSARLSIPPGAWLRAYLDSRPGLLALVSCSSSSRRWTNVASRPSHLCVSSEIALSWSIS